MQGRGLLDGAKICNIENFAGSSFVAGALEIGDGHNSESITTMVI